MSAGNLGSVFAMLDPLNSNRTPLGITDFPHYSMAMHDLRVYCDGTDVWSSLLRQRFMLREWRIAELISKAAYQLGPSIMELITSGSLVSPKDWVERLPMIVWSACLLCSSNICGIRNHISKHRWPPHSFHR